MAAVICTIIICATVTLCTFKICDTYKPEPAAQQLVTQADLDAAYKEASKEKIPDFQEVISFINKEFTGIEEDGDE